MAQIQCEELTLGYEDRVVFRDMNFKVETGDYLCIVGENGSGKSTLMKTLLGLNKPLEGRVVFGDGLKQTEIGYLPQQTDIQRDFPATVFEVVMSGCLNQMGFRLFYGKKEREKAMEKLRLLGMEESAGRSYQDLSGGQQQRVLLARALCASGSLLILDEPVAGLDPVVTKELYDTIRELNGNNITIIMVSHDIDEIVRDADHVLHIASGDYFFGTTDAYQKSEFGRHFISRDAKPVTVLEPKLML